MLPTAIRSTEENQLLNWFVLYEYKIKASEIYALRKLLLILSIDLKQAWYWQLFLR